MGRLFPFRGYRYDPEKVRKIDDVVTQPYDKISAQMLEHYLRRHPANMARITKNADHNQAAQFLHQWIGEGILKQDLEPHFYPYQQRFEFDGRLLTRMGFISLVSLQDADIFVKGHERILKEPLEDRLNLMRATRSNQGLIFMLYADSSLQVDQCLDAFSRTHAPALEVTDEYGVAHRLWRLSNPESQKGISQALLDKPLYIADGHHRFQTSVLYFKECVERGWKAAAVESFDKRMIALFNMEGPGLKILPTHRAIRNHPHFDLPALLGKLESHFEIRKLEHVEELTTLMKEPGHRIGLCCARPWGVYLLALKEAAGSDPSFMPDIQGPARRLDVHILHEGILKAVLGIGPEELSSQRYVDYYRGHQEVAARLQEGDYQAAFLLNPTTLEQVREISERGEKMPQKSTDFYPKLLTGLVLMKMEISE